MSTPARYFLLAALIALVVSACRSLGTPEDQASAGSLWDAMDGYEILKVLRENGFEPCCAPGNPAIEDPAIAERLNRCLEILGIALQHFGEEPSVFVKARVLPKEPRPFEGETTLSARIAPANRIELGEDLL